MAEQARPVVVPGLDDDVNARIGALLARLYVFAVPNARRAALYDQDVMVRALGIDGSRKKNYAAVRSVLGWTTKAVDSLANLVVFEGLVIPGEDLSAYGLDAYVKANRLVEEANQIQTDAMIHGCAFLVTTKGAPGEPRALTTMATASSATGSWNARRRRLDDFLSVTRVTANGQPTEFTYYVPGTALSCSLVGDKWEYEPIPTGLDFVPVEPLVFRPRTGRPFGSSRISHAAASHQESALRTVVRSEIGAEAYIDPVRAILGADNSQFLNSDGTPNVAAQMAMTGRVIVLPPNWKGPDGEPIADDQNAIVPRLETIPGASMDPHRSQLEMFASLFSAETDIPLSEMGIRGGSVPVSAQALQATRNSLNLNAESAITTFGPAHVRAAQTAYLIENGLSSRDEIPEGLGRLDAKYREPSRPSRGEMADFMLKVTGAGAIPSESRVVLEGLGFNPGDIERIEADRRKLAGLAALQQIAGAVATLEGAATP